MPAQMSKPKRPPYRGVDLRPEQRPGVPRDAPPHPLPGAHWTQPEQQPFDQSTLQRLGLTRHTAVFSTALPPRGLSGALRRIAHYIPDHRVSHWLLLLVADRVDVLQNLRLR